MRYPIVIEPGTGLAAFGIVVPDPPGCFSAGDILDEAMKGAEEAAAAWIDAALDGGQAVPPPGRLETVGEIPITRDAPSAVRLHGTGRAVFPCQPETRMCAFRSRASFGRVFREWSTVRSLRSG